MNKDKKIQELEKELERRTKLLEQAITVANVTNRVYVGQTIEWENLGLEDIREFEQDTDVMSWPKQDYPVDCRHTYKGDKSCGGCGCK